MAYNKLSVAEKSERDNHIEILKERWGEFVEAQAELQAHVDELNEKIESYNGAVRDVQAWKDDIAGLISDSFDERSEKWQEGDKGQEYESWKSQWEEFQAEEIEEVSVEYLEEPSTWDELESLPEAPE